MKISDIFVNENKSLKESMKIIDRTGLSIVFITDKTGMLTGVITDGDIRRAILQGASLQNHVKHYMNASPIIVKENYNQEEIKQLLLSGNIRGRVPERGMMRIPVVDDKYHVVDILFASTDNIQRGIDKSLAFEDKIKDVKPVTRVLVVGGTGYLGSVLCRKLLKKGYIVRVLDTLTYGDHGIADLYDCPHFEFIQGDMRNIQIVVNAVKDVDAVIHLAAIVGDPASSINPKETIEINYLGTKLLAEVCKYGQINRFIFASTCSVYGASLTPDERINETSPLNPVSLYAEMKYKSEQGLLEIEDENFSPTILRMATLYGLSPRMRFDLVVNTLTIKALHDKKFSIFGGEQWRPLLHVSDAAEAYIKCIESPIHLVKGKVFNVGSNKENYKIIDVGKIIKSLIPQSLMKVDSTDQDQRNYNVSFTKIQTTLNYSTKQTIKTGVKEIITAVNKGEFDDYPDTIYSNYDFLYKNSILTNNY